jgi:hypothetical protein
MGQRNIGLFIFVAILIDVIEDLPLAGQGKSLLTL